MTPPILVVAKSERIDPSIVESKKGKYFTMDGQKGTIILQDSTGITVTFNDSEMYGSALCASYEKGDTIYTMVK